MSIIQALATGSYAHLSELPACNAKNITLCSRMSELERSDEHSCKEAEHVSRAESTRGTRNHNCDSVGCRGDWSDLASFSIGRKSRTVATQWHGYRFSSSWQAFVLLTGGIDLSTGSVIALTGMTAALVMRSGMPWWLAALTAIAVGALVGLINGSLVHFLKLPPFIVTFAAFGYAASIPLILTGANSVNVADPMFAFIGRGSLFGVPMPVVFVVLAAIVFVIMLRLTPTGVHIYAVGGNKETARLAGIPIGRVTILVYVLSGMCAA